MRIAALFYKQCCQSHELVSQSSLLPSIGKEINAWKIQKHVDCVAENPLVRAGVSLTQIQLSEGYMFSVS